MFTVPSAPEAFTVVGSTQTSLSFAWDEPKLWNGYPKGYLFSLSGKEYEVDDTAIVVDDLQSDKQYDASIKVAIAILHTS